MEIPFIVIENEQKQLKFIKKKTHIESIFEILESFVRYTLLFLFYYGKRIRLRFGGRVCGVILPLLPRCAVLVRGFDGSMATLMQRRDQHDSDLRR